MNLLKNLFSPRRNTASVAKERLKIVLAHERAGRDAPDFLPKLQKELIDVVARYVEIRDDMIRVNSGKNLGKAGDTSLLEINIEIDGAKRRSVPGNRGKAFDRRRGQRLNLAPPDARLAGLAVVFTNVFSAGAWGSTLEVCLQTLSASRSSRQTYRTA